MANQEGMGMNTTKELALTLRIECLEKSIASIKADYKALVEAESKPEYPDDTFGQFGVEKTYGYLRNTKVNNIFRYVHKNQEGNSYYYASIECFTPLPEAILPHPVENTGVCPWKDGDEVRVEFENGDFITNDTPEKWTWKSICGNNIVRSQLIKRAGE